MGDQKTEIEFLSLLHNGKINAFDELYWMYQKAIFRIAFKLVRNTLIAEDIVQEVFISLWEKRRYH